MFTTELTRYLHLVGLIVLDGSEEGKVLFNNIAKRYPSPAALKNATRKEMEELIDQGIQADRLIAALELGEMVIRSKKPLLGHAYSSQLLSREMMDRLSGSSQESLYLVATDIHNEIIDIKEIFVGGHSECNVYPDQLFRRALLQSASGIAVVHNHPSGKIEPSTADVTMMKRLEKGSRLLGLTFLDFLIVGEDSYYSWRENQAFQKKKEREN